MEEQLFSIKDILLILKKKILLIVLITIIFTTIVISITNFLIKPKYYTSAKLFIGVLNNDNESSSNKNLDFSYYSQLIKPYSEIIKSDDLLDKAIKNGNLNISRDALASQLNVVANTESQVLELSIVTEDKSLGTITLNSVINEFKKKSPELIGNTNITVLNYPKMPTSPYYPNKVNSALLGLFGGLALGIAITLILNHFDNSIKSKEDTENSLGIPVIGTIHEFNEKKLKKISRGDLNA